MQQILEFMYFASVFGKTPKTDSAAFYAESASSNPVFHWSIFKLEYDFNQNFVTNNTTDEN